MAELTIDALLSEQRIYPPPPEFAAQANAGPGFYDRDPDEFWTEQGRERISWFTPFDGLPG
jgi:acetyl-CoA synthetase